MNLYAAILPVLSAPELLLSSQDHGWITLVRPKEHFFWDIVLLVLGVLART